MDRLFQILMLSCFYSVLEAQKVLVDPQVTGYQGHNVTLPCTFQGSSTLTQGQWTLGPTKENGTSLGVLDAQHGLHIAQSILTGRVNFTDNLTKGFSMTIRDVRKSDEGRYTCRMTVHPSGSFKGTSFLTVQAQPQPQAPPLSPGVIAGIVIAVLLVMVVMAASVYLFINRNMYMQNTLVSHTVITDTRGPPGTATHAVGEEEDLVYTDITVFKSRGTRGDRSSIKPNRKPPDATNPDDTLYSQVAVRSQRLVVPDDTATYSQVMKKRTCETSPL